MPRGKGISLSGVKEKNRQQIKWVIYHKAPISRQQITDELGVTLPTITTNVAGMLAEGLLIEEDDKTQVVSPAGGRRSQVLDFNADAFFAVGVEIGPYQTMFCVTNLRGKVYAQKVMQLVPEHYEDMIVFLAEQIEELIQESGVTRNKLLGVGIGVPGFIESKEGIVRRNFHKDWEKRPLAKHMSRELQLPVWIDNNARMRAFGREMFGDQQAPDTFAYLFVSRGLCCPLMIKNKVLSGHLASAGEIGHTTVLPGGPVCPTCGRRGCLEAMSGEQAILSSAMQALEQGKAPVLKELLQDGRPLTVTEVLAAQKEGDASIREIMKGVVTYLGIEVANIFNFISPSLVVVDGYIFNNEENRNQLLATAYANLYGLTRQEAQIEFLPYDQLTGAYGAAGFVIRRSLLE